MLLPDLPDTARVWLFAADRPLADDERTALLTRVQAVVAAWTSHGTPVPAGTALAAERVLVVAAALPGGVSGCGIDSMTHGVTQAAGALGLGWTPALDILYRDDAGALRAVSRRDFRALAAEGTVTAETPVLDLTADTLGVVRAGLERPAGQSWHGGVFRLASPATA